MARVLVLASIVWPAVLGAAVWQRAHGQAPVWTAVVYAAGSRVCHQKPERSFHSAAVAWPVCARCSGLYLAAPVGAMAAFVSIGALARSRRRAPTRGWLVGLAVASLPSALTLGVEWAGIATPSNMTRAIAAVPVGAMIAFVLIRTAAGPSQPIE